MRITSGDFNGFAKIFLEIYIGNLVESALGVRLTGRGESGALPTRNVIIEISSQTGDTFLFLRETGALYFYHF